MNFFFTLLFVSATASLDPNKFFQPLSMSTTIQDSTCIVSIDTRIGAFDNQIQWLQASLNEKPCWDSDWIFVFAGGLDPIDHVVLEVIESYAIVDALLVDGDPVEVSIPISPFRGSTIRVESSDSAVIVSSLDHVSKQIGSRRLERQAGGANTGRRKLLSNTSATNLIWAFLVSCVAGLLVNVSVREVRGITYSLITGS